MASQAPPPPSVNPWELRALDYQSHAQDPTDGIPRDSWPRLQDPLTFPGLYSGRGFDLMSIMLRIMSRPRPQIELGAVDCSVSLVPCELELPDTPIVYVSDSFCELTGYSKAEILGRNCRFLQFPGNGRPSPLKSDSSHNKAVARKIRQALDVRNEIQVQLVNYKNGERFNNILSIIPVEIDKAGYHYAVGFQVQAD